MDDRRWECTDCPGFYRNGKESQAPMGHGCEVKEIDGKRVLVCRPAPSEKGRMKPYTLYCLAYQKGKKIGNIYDWTGRTPRWCPRLDGTMALAPKEGEE